MLDNSIVTTYLVGHLNDFGACSDRCTRDDTAIFRDCTGLDNCYIEPIVLLVLRVPTIPLPKSTIVKAETCSA